MDRYPLPLTLLLLVAIAAVPGHAQAQQNKRVWTTEDVNALRSQGLISIVGAEEESPAALAPAAVATQPEAAPQGAVYTSRFEDPEWYADQAAELQAQLDASRAALSQAQDNLAAVRNLRWPTSGVNLGVYSQAVAPDEVIANWQDRVRSVQEQLDGLADLARQNNVDPGVIRAAG